jgi:hypothetical protein
MGTYVTAETTSNYLVLSLYKAGQFVVNTSLFADWEEHNKKHSSRDRSSHKMLNLIEEKSGLAGFLAWLKRASADEERYGLMGGESSCATCLQYHHLHFQSIAHWHSA